MKRENKLKSDLVAACRVLAHFRMVEGFGHVSARLPGTDRFLITPRKPLALVSADELVEVDLAGKAVGPGDPPLEAPMHAAVYRRRSDVQAICRAHPRHVAVFAACAEPIRCAHGLGATLGQTVPVFANPRLITAPELGDQVAEALGQGEAIILRANGMLAVGQSVSHACVKALLLEESAEINLLARSACLELCWMTAEEVAIRRGDDPVHEPIRAWEYYAAMAKLEAAPA